MTRSTFVNGLRLCAWVVAGLLAGCESSKSGGNDFGSNDPNVVSVMGDSIALDGTPAWPSILASQTGKNVVNHGGQGADSGSGVGAVGGVLGADKPGYLLIAFGANDVIMSRGADSLVENLRSIVRAAKANKTVPVVATLTPMYGSHRIFDGGTKNVNPMISKMADEEGAELADLAGAFGDDASLVGDDGLHLTQAGHEKVASVMSGFVK